VRERESGLLRGSEGSGREDPWEGRERVREIRVFEDRNEEERERKKICTHNKIFA